MNLQNDSARILELMQTISLSTSPILLSLKRKFARSIPASRDGTYKRFVQWLKENYCNGQPSLEEIQTVIDEDVAYNYDHNSAAISEALYTATSSPQLDGYLYEENS